MRHARDDYNRIQDPAVDDPTLANGEPIAEDEPVFLLRARDVLAPNVVRYWAESLRQAGGDLDTAAAVERWAAEMERWGSANGVKIPDTPPWEMIP